MNKLLLILVLTLSGCASGVVTLERPIPANMLSECPESLPVAVNGKSDAVLRTSVQRTAIYRECKDTHNALVDFLGKK